MNEINSINKCVFLDNTYYAINDNKDINVFNETFNLLMNLETKTEYTAIAYDENKKVFYLSKYHDTKCIYYTEDFKTILSLNLPFKCYSEIKDISYCNYCKCLLLVTNCTAFMFDINENTYKVIFEIKEKIDKILSCTKALCCPNISNVVLENITSCNKDIYISYRRGSISSICKVVNKKLEKPCYQTRGNIRTFFLLNNELCILVNLNQSQKIYYLDIDCSCTPDSDDDCSCGIIQSIALIEKSLAKILANEALKIKSALENTTKIDELICVNSSVEEMIYRITALEFILTEKLKSVNNKNNCCK